jgi:hypothetical protein
MPIRINLLAEAQAAEEMRRKDPVKRAIWIGAFAVFLVLLCSFTLQFKIMATRAEVSSLQMSWKTIEKEVQNINEHRNATRQLEQRLSALDQFTTNRMLWASALNALQYTPVEGIELVRVRSDQTFLLNEGSRPRTNEHGIVVQGKPSTVTEKILLTIEAKDFSTGLNDLVPQYKQTLASYPYFQAHLQKTNTVQLTSLSAPQTEVGRTFRAFGMQLFFEEKERRLYE